MEVTPTTGCLLLRSNSLLAMIGTAIPQGNEMESKNASDAKVLPEHVQAPYLHAGFWMRFAAYLIDGLILMPVFAVMEFALVIPVVVSHRGQGDPGAFLGIYLVAWLVMAVVWWLYYAFFESSKLQATPGKLALALQVTDLQGRRLGFGRATARFFGKIVSRVILDIGYMMAGWTVRKQALHDMMADTCVVRRDWLLQWEKSGLDDSVPVPSKTPAWAVTLIVIGVLFCVLVPIVAILAAIAIPAYQNYLIRSQISEGLTLAAPVKVAVANYANGHGGTIPTDNAAAGVSSPEAISGRFVTQVAVQGGDVVISYGNRANSLISGDHLILHPQAGAFGVQWSCGSDDIKPQYLPPACR